MNLASTDMSRKGRPPKQGPRTLSGRLRPRTDFGTPEVIAKRLSLVGAADATLAHYPLGVALARNVISLEQHDAGLSYARDYRLAMDGLPPRLQPSIARELPSSATILPDRVESERTAAFMAKAATLLRMSRQTKDDLENLVVFDRWPGWLISQRMPSPRDLRQRARVIAALDALARMA